MRTKETILMSCCTVVVVLAVVFTAIKANINRNTAGTIEEEVATTISETTTTEPESTTKETTTTTTTEKETTTTTTKKITNTTEIIITENDGTKTNLGSFYITCYTPYSDGGKWGYQTSTGATSTHLKTCAVDPSVIPLGSTIYINGLELKAVDIGGMVKGKHVDIFYDGTGSEAKAWLEDFGTRADVYI